MTPQTTKENDMKWIIEHYGKVLGQFNTREQAMEWLRIHVFPIKSPNYVLHHTSPYLVRKVA